MAGAGMHYRTRYKADLSPRQREVLDLVARGYTNGQIAERLGLTLDGAKWHVSEILSKLEFDTREEAGRYWRAEHALPRRIARAMPGLGMLGLRPLLISAVAAVVIVGGIAAYIALRADESSDSSQPTAAATTNATVTVPAPALYGTPVDNPAIQSVSMVDATTGWAISQQPAAVLRTVDGGGHWRDVLTSKAGPARVDDAHFMDAQHAWVAQATLPADAGETGSETIWRTTDGGRTWQAGEPIPGQMPGMLTFADATHGWFLQSQGAGAGQEGVAIYRTTDGGKHWTQAMIDTPETSDVKGVLPTSCIKSGMTFIDAQRGWVTAQCNGASPFFYGTTDGGATWRQISLPSPDDPSQTLTQCMCDFQPPQFVDAMHGFLPATVDQHLVYITDDGGLSWKVAGVVPASSAMVIYSFPDAEHGFAVTNAGPTLYQTVDGGKTWSVEGAPPLFGEGLAAIEFVDATHGWVVRATQSDGGGPVLLRTSDGGKTWVVASPK